MNKQTIDTWIDEATSLLLTKRTQGGLWRGELSSSAISTAVAIFALRQIDVNRYAETIQRGAEWLLRTMQADGSWGDSIESPSNMTATLLTYAALFAMDQAPEATRHYLSERFGGVTDEAIIKGVLTYYGKDLTFSVPILVMCASAGVIHDWERIPPLPFELSVLPQRLFRFLQLPVVSYAIPALIAVGILRFQRGKQGILSPLRRRFIAPSLRVLERLQPVHGGFLEAAPLTAFVSMCLSCAGFRSHPVTQKAAQFLLNTVRPDGSWPIDTDISGWVTSISIKVLADDLSIDDRRSLDRQLCANAFTYPHPFTGARPGGWGWSDLPGAVPDADDTSGALVALSTLRKGVPCPEVVHGIEWLLALQNRDGGMPTFCKGWGKLPFDRSSPDISAHALLAFVSWQAVLPTELQARCQRSIQRLLDWMKQAQAADGSWSPLWFGDQDAPQEQSLVYGTATATEYLSASSDPLAVLLAAKGVRYLLAAQNSDGGWGGTKGAPSKVTLTAKALSALASYPDCDPQAIERGFDWLYQRYTDGTWLQREPIGLYFARLWYSEELYSLTFVLQALKKLKQYNERTETA